MKALITHAQAHQIIDCIYRNRGELAFSGKAGAVEMSRTFFEPLVERLSTPGMVNYVTDRILARYRMEMETPGAALEGRAREILEGE